ncbi:MAG: class I SAM-dependent methyltransferase [Planctomycetota bacterium]
MTANAKVSITAHYTAEVWRRARLAPSALGTPQGRVLHLLLRGPSWLAGRLNGGHPLELVLLRRHLLIDHLVGRAIATRGVASVLELACGLSGRGLRLTRAHPALRYVESDLPGMVEVKRRALRRTGRALAPGHRLLALDALAPPDAWRAALGDALDLGRPVLVIAEGLLTYLTGDEVRRTWASLLEALAPAPSVGYLANLPFPDHGAAGGSIRALHRLLAGLVRRPVQACFASPPEAEAALRAAGFDEVELHAPTDWAQTLGLPAASGPPVQRVVEAWRATPPT